jgi:hypothetical protein
MNKTYYRLRHLSLGKRILWSWSLFWFLLVLPASLLWDAINKGSATIGDLLFLSLAFWMLVSTIGIVLWLVVKGTMESMSRKSEELYTLED